MSRRAGVAMMLPLLHIHAQADRRLERDGHGLAFLAELRVTEENFVAADRHRQVANGGLADALAVDPDFGPPRRIHIEDAERQLNRDPDDPAPRHLDGPRN